MVLLADMQDFLFGESYFVYNPKQLKPLIDSLVKRVMSSDDKNIFAIEMWLIKETTECTILDAEQPILFTPGFSFEILQPGQESKLSITINP